MASATVIARGARTRIYAGVTLIELLIVMAVMGILLSLAVPGYTSYLARVNRAEAISLLLQASMCQQRIHASRGNYDTGECLPRSEQDNYRISYQPPNTAGQQFVIIATPVGNQATEACGRLMLDQNGARRVSAKNTSAAKCWSGR